MIDSESGEFSRIWNMALETKGKVLSDAAIEMTFEVLRPYALADIKAAVYAHLRDPDEGQYPILPAHITKFISGSSKTNAAIAWNKVVEGIKRVGSHSDIIFDDPIIHVVVRDMGGWVQICGVSNKELPFKGNEFKTLYEGHLKRGIDSHPPRLLGTANAENRRLGVDPEEKFDEVVMFGNHEQAARVAHDGAAKRLTVHRNVAAITDKLRLTNEQLTHEGEQQ